MKNERGSATLAVVGAIVGVIVLFVVFIGFGYVGFQNDCNQNENAISAQYKQNQNEYDNGWKTVMEKAQVPKMYTNQLKSLYAEAMKDRYGANGSQALLQFIQEKNPELPSDVFVQIQQSIESFHNRFNQAQKDLLQRKLTYQNLYTATVSGRIYNSFAHYPHIDLSKFDIVTSEETEKAFDTKKAPALKIE